MRTLKRSDVTDSTGVSRYPSTPSRVQLRYVGPRTPVSTYPRHSHPSAASGPRASTPPDRAPLTGPAGSSTGTTRTTWPRATSTPSSTRSPSPAPTPRQTPPTRSRTSTAATRPRSRPPSTSRTRRPSAAPRRSARSRSATASGPRSSRARPWPSARSSSERTAWVLVSRIGSTF